MAFGSFLGALGQAFSGYGRDQERRTADKRNTALDAQTAELHKAQMGNYNTQAADRTQQIAQEKYLASPEFENTYYAARQGDEHSIAAVARAVAGHANAAAIMAPFNRQDPLANEKAMVDYRNAHPGPSSERAATSQELAAKRADMAAATTQLADFRRDIPKPSTVPRQILGTDPTNPKRQTMIENPAREKAVTDSTAYERNIMDPARANLARTTDALSRAGGNSAAPAAAPKETVEQADARLKATGMKAADRAKELTRLGFNVSVR